MIAANMIKINGKWYQPGEELPADRKPNVEPTKPDLNFDVESLNPENFDRDIQDSKETDYTRKDIMDMKYFALKSLANKHGISADNKKTEVLRNEVIKALGL